MCPRHRDDGSSDVANTELLPIRTILRAMAEDCNRSRGVMEIDGEALRSSGVLPKSCLVHRMLREICFSYYTQQCGGTGQG